MSEPAAVVYLDMDDLLAAMTVAVGGRPDVRDWGLLESALARPQATVFGEDAYPTVLHKAAALLQSLVTNHALIDGNKRLGWVAVRLFLELNGYRISGGEERRFCLIMDVAEHDRLDTVEGIANRLALIADPVQ